MSASRKEIALAFLRAAASGNVREANSSVHPPGEASRIGAKHRLAAFIIVPTVLGELMSGKDAARSQRVMEAMLKMVKLDVKKLKEAAKGKVRPRQDF